MHYKHLRYQNDIHQIRLVRNHQHFYTCRIRHWEVTCCSIFLSFKASDQQTFWSSSDKFYRAGQLLEQILFKSTIFNLSGRSSWSATYLRREAIRQDYSRLILPKMWFDVLLRKLGQHVALFATIRNHGKPRKWEGKKPYCWKRNDWYR